MRIYRTLTKETLNCFRQKGEKERNEMNKLKRSFKISTKLVFFQTSVLSKQGIFLEEYNVIEIITSIFTKEKGSKMKIIF